MAETFGSGQTEVNRMKLEGIIRDIIFDALFICDIENDKIPTELKTELHRCVENLMPDDPERITTPTPPITEKLSITGEEMETLHARVMGAVRERLSVLGITDTKKLDELGEVVFSIIQNEKAHRDAEKKMG